MKNFEFLKNLKILAVLVVTAFAISCTEDDGMMDEEEPIASFQFEVSEENFLQVTFSNFSQNATSYSWDFGDNSDANMDESPMYTYTEAGSYTVTLTATNDAGDSAEKSETVVITDPLAAQRTLVGDNGKVWRLLADVSGGVYPLQVGPSDRSQIWWAYGGPNDFDELCVRECIFDDTWTFNTDGTYTFENNDTFWGEGGVWKEDLVGCFDASTAANFVGPSDEDLSGWDSGTHSFDYDVSASKLTITGGFIGLTKVGSTAEITVPQASVEYQVIKLVDADVDTLVLETVLTDAGGYWAFTLVSYDNESSAIEIEECPPVTMVDVTLSVNMNEYGETFTTPEVNGTWNGWCGNCNAMSDEDEDGIWETTVTIAANTDFEYKFSYDNWAGQEALTPGSSCTITTGDNTNRTLSTEEGNLTISPVCWNSCENCGGSTTDVINIDFESNPPTWTAFGGTDSNGAGVTVTTPANPVSGGINTSATVAQIDELEGSQGWTGIHTTLDKKIDFSTKTTIKVKVYSPFAGAIIKFKVEDSTNGDVNKEIDLMTTAANTWEELTYTFTAEDSNKFDRIVLFFDFLTATKTGDRTHYFDDIILE